MWYENVGTTFFHFITKHAFDIQTDRQMDIQTAFSCLDHGTNLLGFDKIIVTRG